MTRQQRGVSKITKYDGRRRLEQVIDDLNGDFSQFQPVGYQDDATPLPNRKTVAEAAFLGRPVLRARRLTGVMQDSRFSKYQYTAMGGLFMPVTRPGFLRELPDTIRADFYDLYEALLAIRPELTVPAEISAKGFKNNNVRRGNGLRDVRMRFEGAVDEDIAAANSHFGVKSSASTQYAIVARGLRHMAVVKKLEQAMDRAYEDPVMIVGRVAVMELDPTDQLNASETVA